MLEGFTQVIDANACDVHKEIPFIAFPACLRDGCCYGSRPRNDTTAIKVCSDKLLEIVNKVPSDKSIPLTRTDMPSHVLVAWQNVEERKVAFAVLASLPGQNPVFVQCALISDTDAFQEDYRKHIFRIKVAADFSGFETAPMLAQRALMNLGGFAKSDRAFRVQLLYVVTDVSAWADKTATKVICDWQRVPSINEAVDLADKKRKSNKPQADASTLLGKALAGAGKVGEKSPAIGLARLPDLLAETTEVGKAKEPAQPKVNPPKRLFAQLKNRLSGHQFDLVTGEEARAEGFEVNDEDESIAGELADCRGEQGIVEEVLDNFEHAAPAEQMGVAVRAADLTVVNNSLVMYRGEQVGRITTPRLGTIACECSIKHAPKEVVENGKKKKKRCSRWVECPCYLTFGDHKLHPPCLLSPCRRSEGLHVPLMMPNACVHRVTTFQVVS